MSSTNTTTTTTTTTSVPTSNNQDNNNDSNNKMIVMVTGGSGLVGQAIRTYVESFNGTSSSTNNNNNNNNNKNETWIYLSSQDGDLRCRQETDVLFQKYQPTHVLHLAAKVGGLFANMAQKVEFFRENILINDNVMECCRMYKVQKLVSMLSTCIFPNDISYPIDEGMLHDGPPHPSNEGYAYAKRLIDTMNRAYGTEYGCNFTSIIPTNIYGPYDNFNIHDGHVIPGLIHKCYVAKQTNTSFCIWGSGTPLRQFIYSADLAELVVWVMRHYDSPEPITLSVDEDDEVSIADVAYAVASAMKFDGDVVFDTTKADGQFKKTASNQKLRRLLPDYQFTTIDDGIQKTVDWFVANYETARK